MNKTDAVLDTYVVVFICIGIQSFQKNNHFRLNLGGLLCPSVASVTFV